MKKFNKISLVVLALSFMLFLAGPIMTQAATSPSLGAAASFSVIAQTLITGLATISGNVGSNNVTGGNSITALTTANVTPGIMYSKNGANTGGGSPTTLLDLGTTVQPNLSTAYGLLDAGTNAIGSCTKASDGSSGSDTGVTELAGLSLAPGLYCTTGSFAITGNLILTGTTGTWVFKSDTTLTTSVGSSVTGGDPCNVWWRIGSAATIGNGTSFIGTIIAHTGIHFGTNFTLNGRALAEGADVTLNSGGTISGPTCAAAPDQGSRQGTINVVKIVINDNGGTKTVADFPLFVDGTLVVSGVTNSFRAPASAYTVTETANSNYTRSFSGDCDANGQIGLNPGDNKFCIVTNNDIGAPIIVPPVPPIIDVVKVPSPLALPNGPGLVNYTYTLRNIGTVPATDITMVGDTCSPITLASGDTNNDAKLDLNETWVYKCSTTLTATHTNTVVATGWANGLSAVDIASATVIVGLPIVPPLIHVTKVPNPLTLSAKGGLVTYTEKITNPGTVALSNVRLTDDKCAPLKYISGDTNKDSKLDTTETWTYTCRTNLTKTTTNTAVATGEANGLTVRDFAIATVVVATAVPKLPNTGLASSGGNTAANFAILLAVITLMAGSLFIILKKRKI